jgi:hypothetical protein
METIIIFFSTPQGVALSSIVTISSLIYALFQRSKTINISNEIITKNNKITTLEIQNTELTQQLTLISDSNNELKINNSQLTKTVNNLENGDLNCSKQSVSQTGKNNINNGDIDGDVTLKLS